MGLSPTSGLVGREEPETDALRLQSFNPFVEVLTFKVNGSSQHLGYLRYLVEGESPVTIRTFKPGVSRACIDDQFQSQFLIKRNTDRKVRRGYGYLVEVRRLCLEYVLVPEHISKDISEAEAVLHVFFVENLHLRQAL